MINIFKNKQQKEEFVSTYKDPFKSDKVKKIEFTIEKSWLNDSKVTFKSRTNFDSGATTGYHRMEADSFPEIVEKTEAFIRSL